MPDWWKALRDTYLTLDRRMLGLFRVGLGLVLLYDVGRRFPQAGLLWSDAGLLTSASLHKAPQGAGQFSLLFGCSSQGSVQLAFAALALVSALYLVGLFTRVAQVLVLVGYASLNARNLFFEDGGTGVVILLLGWTVLLPLGDCCSLDALRQEAAAPTLRRRVALRRAARRPVVTLAGLALLLQAAVIYWLNAVQKSGTTWRSGDAVHLVLWQHRVNTPLALWFAAREPSWFSPLATWLTRRTEYIMPLLLLWPSHPLGTRLLAFALALLLHGGIALCLTLGPFSYAMICLLWLAVPGEALDLLAARVPRRVGRLWARRRARWLARWQRLKLSGRSARSEGSRAPNGGFRALNGGLRTRSAPARELLLAGMLLVETVSVLHSNRAVPPLLRIARPGPWLAAYKPFLRGYQSWSMFAPDAPTEDGTLIVDAVTRDGRHLNPFTGEAPDFDQIRHGLSPYPIALSDYCLAMRDPHNARYRLDLARYLRRWPARSPADRLVSAEFWWVSYVPPLRGSYAPGPLKKQRLWGIKL